MGSMWHGKRFRKNRGEGPVMFRINHWSPARSETATAFVPLAYSPMCLLVLCLLYAGLFPAVAVAQNTVTLAASSVEATTATLTISGYSGTWYYKYTTPTGGTCSSAVTDTTVSLSSLLTGRNYSFRAYSDSNCSTGLTTNTTDATFLTKPGQMSQPSVSRGLDQDPGIGRMSITWSRIQGEVTKYRLQWKSGSQEYPTSTGNRQVDLGHPLTTHLINTVGTRVYTFRIRAGNGTGWGDWSEDVSETAVCAPCPRLATESVGATTVTLRISGYSGGWTYKYTTPTGGTCSSRVPSGTSTKAVTGLAGNTSYTYTAYADSGCETELAAAGAFVTKPGQPSTPTATAGAGSGRLTLAAMVTGSGTLTKWQYLTKAGTNAFATTWTDVGVTTTTLSHVVTGLTDGTRYQFKVRAVNATGTSAASEASAAVAPSAAIVPPAPTKPGVTGGHASVALTWTSGGDGGSAITKWQYVKKVGSNNFETTWTDIPSSGASTTSYTVTGLTNGTAYRFKVRAVNSVGNGTASPASDAVTPTPAATAPLAPTKPGVTGGHASVALTWTSGGDGGSAITKWQYVKKVGSNNFETTWTDIPSSGASTTSYTVTGLTNGTAYRFKVRAVNSVGNGAASPASDAVIPTPAATAPLAPTKPGVTGGHASVALTWTSGGDGGSAITKWQYVKKVGSNNFETTWTDIPSSGASTTSYTVTGLTNGIAYRFKVRAVNSVGNGPASPASDAVTPAATAPLAPTKPTVAGGHASVALTWSSGGDGGSAITKWQYQQKADTGSYGSWMNIPGSGPATTSHTVTGLSNDTTYQFRVRAVNAHGPGAASEASDPVRPLSAAEQALLTNVLAAQGRALLTGAMEVIGQRFRAPRPGGAAAGREGDGTAAALGTVVRLLGLMPEPGDAPGPAFGAHEPLSADTGPRRVGPRGARPAWTLNQLASRSFALPLSAVGAKGLQGWTLWGAGATQCFEGSPDVGQYDGPLSSLYLGLDTRLSPAWLAGAAVSHSWGTADYTLASEGWGGQMETRLTSIYPYVQGTVAHDLELWALGGYGWGEVENRAGGPYLSPETSDLTMAMGAAGLRQPLTERAGVQVALVGSGGYLALSTDEGIQAVDDLRAEVLQARVAVEATRAFGALAPYLQVGGRADGGDGQTGAGLETVAGGAVHGRAGGFRGAGALAGHAFGRRLRGIRRHGAPGGAGSAGRHGVAIERGPELGPGGRDRGAVGRRGPPVGRVGPVDADATRGGERPGPGPGERPGIRRAPVDGGPDAVRGVWVYRRRSPGEPGPGVCLPAHGGVRGAGSKPSLGLGPAANGPGHGRLSAGSTLVPWVLSGTQDAEGSAPARYAMIAASLIRGVTRYFHTGHCP